MGALFASGVGTRRGEIDNVFGVYYDEHGTMLGDKKFDVDTDDTIIVGDTRYRGTPGLYELIFKREPDETVYTDNDKQTYKIILLTTNAHKRHHDPNLPVKGNKGKKWRNIIGPLVSGESRVGAGIPSAVRLTDNKIEYVHWDDPNELVNRLRLLDASHRAGNSAHDNEMLSIIEELREAGVIV